jgi:CrcB protein
MAERDAPSPMLQALGITLAIALGSLLGGSLRGVLGLLQVGANLPWATLFANVSGSLLIGLYAALSALPGRIHHGPMLRHFVMTGFCGGYTTFSIFSLESWLLVEAGRPLAAVLLVLASALLWMLAVAAGYRLGRRM